MKLLIAEDDNDLRYALQVFFQRNHFTVDAVDNGADALAYLQLDQYDAAVLDVMMPKMDGVAVVRALRAEKNTTPILLLTAKAEIEDRVEGLDAGANDYLPKPFDVRELLARVRVLTRPQTQQTAKLQLGNTTLDTTCFLLIGPKGEETLTNKEYQTFLLLMLSPGTPAPVETIMHKVWEPDSAGQENALWTIIYNLRKKLAAIGADAIIQNKRNLGYVLEVHNLLGIGDPWFCKYICPVGTLEAGVPLVLLNPELQGAIGWHYIWKIAILILILMSSRWHRSAPMRSP